MIKLIAQEDKEFDTVITLLDDETDKATKILVPKTTSLWTGCVWRGSEPFGLNLVMDGHYT